MIATCTLIGLLAAVLVPLLLRDLRRSAARRVRTVTITLSIDTSAFVAAMRRASLAAADFERALAKASAAIRTAERRVRP